MGRSREELDRTIVEKLREIAPFDPALGRRTVRPDEADLAYRIAALWFSRDHGGAVSAAEPGWTTAGRKLIGIQEVPGPRHNPLILKFWQLGASWLTTDEDPWCGGFMAWCMKEAGLPFPKLYPRAAEWRSYGRACTAQVGAIGVKARPGGNHVFQIVGITADGAFFKALGGNQSNGVNISDIRVGETDSIRWPPGEAERNIPLPVMARGTIRSEA